MHRCPGQLSRRQAAGISFGLLFHPVLSFRGGHPVPFSSFHCDLMRPKPVPEARLGTRSLKEESGVVTPT